MRQRLITPLQAGQLLTARRKSRGQPQAALASQLGISQNRLSELESSPERITLDRLLLLADALGFELVLQDKGEDAAPLGVRESAPEW
ncbi:helix-turn-helix domain-containing protein [Derxia gummosa]|uniref:Helix-turn-helix domain-containing protein n=1 Tax=Derxia gummosa DSM 723 TaxID=1121388 RepID=A0A8B6X7H6_9BURK|nr:helix-turn-helix domain-containing protein [Derxia gummosa]